MHGEPGPASGRPEWPVLRAVPGGEWRFVNGGAGKSFRAWCWVSVVRLLSPCLDDAFQDGATLLQRITQHKRALEAMQRLDSYIFDRPCHVKDMEPVAASP